MEKDCDHVSKVVSDILHREEQRYHAYGRELQKIHQRLTNLEQTIYMGNGRPSLLQQITEINLKLEVVTQALEATKVITSQKRVVGFQVLLEGTMMVMISLFSALIAVWFSHPYPYSKSKVPINQKPVESVPFEEHQRPADPQH